MLSKSNVKQIEKEIDNFLGVEDNIQLLEHILKATSDKQYERQLLKANKEQSDLLQNVIKYVKAIKLDIPERQNVLVENIHDFPKFPKDIEINNLKDIKFPSQFDIKEPNWFNKSFNSLLKSISELKQEITDRITTIKIHRNSATNPVAVRLSNGKSFINTLTQVVSSSGRFVPFTKANGDHDEPLIDNDRKLVVSGLEFDSNSSLETTIIGYIDTNNSTTETLNAGISYTGIATDVTNAGIIFVNVYSDVASATDGLKIEQSSDGVNWDHDDKFTIPATTGKNFSINPYGRYIRVVYTNGGSNQGVFRLQTIIKSQNAKPSSHRIQDAISDDDDAELVKAVLTGETPTGIFTNFQSTRRGNFKVAIQEYGDTPSIDAFSRLRISDPYTIFDSKQLHDKQPLFWDESIGGSATSVHSSTDARVRMTVTANSSDFVIRQTKQRFNYQPGKSQLALLTFYAPQEAGLTKRIGIFDGTSTNNLTPNNGIFFECNDSISWNVAKNGSTTETVLQSSWNYDTLDGSGDANNPSGITLDLGSTQILIIDYEWLGVGRIRVGFVIDGIIRYVHYFNHANNNSFTSVYMSTPNLPIRYDIQTDGTAGSTLDHICSTVMSEGGVEQTGVLRSVDTGTTHVDADVANTTYAVVGIRLKSTYLDVTVTPQFFTMINRQSQDFRWSLCLNPTIAGTFTYNDATNSAIQYATGATANTVSSEGIVVDSGYIRATNQGGGSTGRNFVTSLNIGSQIDATRDELVLCVTPLGASADIHGSLTIRELL